METGNGEGKGASSLFSKPLPVPLCCGNLPPRMASVSSFLPWTYMTLPHWGGGTFLQVILYLVECNDLEIEEYSGNDV